MRILLIIFYFILLIFSFNAWTTEKQLTFKFGVFPYLPTDRIIKSYTPIAEDFEIALGVPVTLRTKRSFSRFQEALENEEYDIAFIQPYDYIKYHKRSNYLPIARRSKDLKTLIVVKKDSPYTSLKQLKGLVIATPPKQSALSIITDKILADEGISQNSAVIRSYKKNHFACMQSVIIGSIAACGTAERALSDFKKLKMTDKFRIIHRSLEIPNSLFVVHQRVPAEVREQLTKLIINWPNTISGKLILSDNKIVSMVRAKDSDYDVIR